MCLTLRHCAVQVKKIRTKLFKVSYNLLLLFVQHCGRTFFIFPSGRSHEKIFLKIMNTLSLFFYIVYFFKERKNQPKLEISSPCPFRYSSSVTPGLWAMPIPKGGGGRNILQWRSCGFSLLPYRGRISQYIHTAAERSKGKRRILRSVAIMQEL